MSGCARRGVYRVMVHCGEGSEVSDAISPSLSFIFLYGPLLPLLLLEGFDEIGDINILGQFP